MHGLTRILLPAVVVPSISEVSPNLVIEALRYNKPVIMTQESGLANLLQETVLLVNPLDPHDLKKSILQLANPISHRDYEQRAAKFNKTHSWSAIASDFLTLIFFGQANKTSANKR